MTRAVLALTIIIASIFADGAVSDAMAAERQSAVVLMYHRFGDSRHPSTNVTLEQLDAHIAELTNGDYNVIPLSELVDRLIRGEGFADRTVAITIDDAYETVYTNGWPRFRDAGLPFTVFVSTGAVDRQYEDMMSWGQLREMQADGVEIGGHTVSHLHMPFADETRNRDELTQSNARFHEELGVVPTIFAYPYGEASLEVINLVKEAGYRVAFGQHSGALSPSENMFYLPRFALNENYGDLGRFRTAVNSLAIPTRDVTPMNMAIKPDSGHDNPPPIGFTIDDPTLDIGALTCFLSHEGAAKIERLGPRVEIRATDPFPPGRSRLNCTLPASGADAGRWHWFGQLFVLPED